MMGPNTLSGHLSVIYTSECQINLTMRLIKPILRSVQTVSWQWPSLRRLYDIVQVKASAERKDINMVQMKAKNLVWATGCSSWFIDPNSGRNSIMFPDWQYKFWIRSVLVPWGDFIYRSSPTLSNSEAEAKSSNGVTVAAVTGVMVGIGALMFGTFRK
jgi:hypothetical protein